MLERHAHRHTLTHSLTSIHPYKYNSKSSSSSRTNHSFTLCIYLYTNTVLTVQFTILRVDSAYVPCVVFVLFAVAVVVVVVVTFFLCSFHLSCVVNSFLCYITFGRSCCCFCSLSVCFSNFFICLSSIRLFDMYGGGERCQSFAVYTGMILLGGIKFNWEIISQSKSKIN